MDVNIFTTFIFKQFIKYFEFLLRTESTASEEYKLGGFKFVGDQFQALPGHG